VDGLCRRWGQRPSQILAEDAQYINHLLYLVLEEPAKATTEDDDA
jgi:hypothetical protein